MKSYWNNDRKSKLISIYSSKPKEEILKEFPEKSWETIRGYARNNGFKRQVDCIKWNEKELNILLEKYVYSSKEEIMKLLPNRTWISIYSQAEKLKIRRKIISNLKISSLNLSEFEKGYISGMIDGEGCIYYHEYHSGILHIDITITNTNRECLEYIQKVLGFGRINKDSSHIKKHPKWRESYKLEIVKQGDVIVLLNEIKDLLIIKRKKCYECLDYLYKWLNSERRNVRYYLREEREIIQSEKYKTDYHSYYSKIKMNNIKNGS